MAPPPWSYGRITTCIWVSTKVHRWKHPHWHWGPLFERRLYILPDNNGWILPRCLGRYPKWHARAQGMEADWPSMSMQIMLGTKCRSVTGIIMLLNNTRWYGSRKAENRWNLHVWFRARCSKIAIDLIIEMRYKLRLLGVRLEQTVMLETTCLLY
jgi:hypothetical protein